MINNDEVKDKQTTTKMINLTNTKDIKLGTLSEDQSKVIARLYSLTDWTTKSLHTNDLEELAKACSSCIVDGSNIDINIMASLYKYLLDHEVLKEENHKLTWVTIPDKYKHQN